MTSPTPEAVSNTWVAVGLLKASVAIIILLVKFRVAPSPLLIAIPCLYVGVALYAVVNKVYSAAALCGIILVVGFIITRVPSPARDFFLKLWNQS